MISNCLISSFYIKPQHCSSGHKRHRDCLISSFYIKPQPYHRDKIGFTIVLYRLSTSNHNMDLFINLLNILSYIVFLHQTTTELIDSCRCGRLSYIVFLHQTTTVVLLQAKPTRLSYIVFLHQTTTNSSRARSIATLSYIVFLHQTTTLEEYEKIQS